MATHENAPKKQKHSKNAPHPQHDQQSAFEREESSLDDVRQALQNPNLNTITPDTVLQLQRLYGNQFVLRMLSDSNTKDNNSHPGEAPIARKKPQLKVPPAKPKADGSPEQQQEWEQDDDEQVRDLDGMAFDDPDSPANNRRAAYHTGIQRSVLLRHGIAMAADDLAAPHHAFMQMMRKTSPPPKIAPSNTGTFLQRATGNMLIQRKVEVGEIVTVTIYLKEGKIFVKKKDGSKFSLELNRTQTTVTAGKYSPITHTEGIDVDKDSDLPGNWRYMYDADVPQWSEFPTSDYTLIVKGSFSDNLKEGKGEGEGDGSGSGEKGEGVGETGEGGTGSDAVVEEFYESLNTTGVPVEGRSDDVVKDLLTGMNAAERRDLLRLMKDAYDESGLPVDMEKFLTKYKEMTPSERELLRTNLELATSDSASPEIPDEIQIALKTDASETATASADAEKFDKDLAAIQKMISPANPHVSKEDFDPIELYKMPFFKDMMLMQGLLAGASAKSPEIQGIAKELIGSIQEIRSYVIEEVKWLMAELAVGAIISALTGPGAVLTTTVYGARALMLVRRLNKLRKFLEKAQQVYNTYEQVKGAVDRVISTADKLEEFRTKYDEWMEKLTELNARLVTADPDEDIEGMINNLEAEIMTEIQTRLEKKEGFGAILEYFYIPADITQQQLKELIFNIPRGIDALEEVKQTYGKVKPGDLEGIKTLTFKGTRAGALLYPFVGYLASIVADKLTSLLQEKDLSERLTGLLTGGSRITSKGRKRPAATAADRRKAAKAKLKTVKTPTKRPLKKPKPKDASEKKKDKKALDAEWRRVVQKVDAIALRESKNPLGMTQSALQTEGRKIARAHPDVASSPRVKRNSDKGAYRLSIGRKDGPQTATVDVFKPTVERQKDGARYIKHELRDFEVGTMNRDAVKAALIRKVTPFKKRFGYASLEVRYVVTKKKGWYVFGTMPGRNEIEIMTISDTTDLHKGTKDDPIPIQFYKEPGNYMSKVKLQIDGEWKEFGRHATTKLDHTPTRQIQIGFHQNYLIKKGDKLKRQTTFRSGKKQQYYREVMKAHGFQWNQGGKEYQADHVKDLGFDGKDDYNNLWPLEKERNEYAYNVWYEGYTVEYITKSGRVDVGSIRELKGKWFIVMGFKRTPRKLGGRGKNTV